MSHNPKLTHSLTKLIDTEQAQWLFGSNTAESYGSHTITRASGDIIVYKNHFLENNSILKTEKILPTGDVVEYSNPIDDISSSVKSCGMLTESTYRTNYKLFGLLWILYHIF